VDIIDKVRSSMNYDWMDQEFFKYLDSICANYGFIKRYPGNKLPLTGWNEPWHYRYVGVEAATFIMEHGICYEEFYKHYRPEFKY
jgi:D-alanyl-D-alanine carboxypeptidase